MRGSQRGGKRPENRRWGGRGREQAGRDRVNERQRKAETRQTDRHMEGTSETGRIRLRETEMEKGRDEGR